MRFAKTAACISLFAVLTSLLTGCPKKQDDEPPPPPPTATQTAAPPPPTVSVAQLATAAPVAPPPGTTPTFLAQAIEGARPQMADTTGVPDEGGNTLLKWWLEKSYPWAQLDGIPQTQAAAFLANPAGERGKRICAAGTVQSINKKTAAPPHHHEGVLATKEGETIAYDAVLDVTGIAANGQGRFCGIATGVITQADGKRAVRLVGMFDTPANRGGGGGGGFGNLGACCQALAQNAVSMPPPQNLYAANAAAYCKGAVASISSPAQKDAVLAGIRGALKGVPMPAVCR